MKFETFTVPHIPASLSGLSDRVAVVGLLGKSSIGGTPNGDKGAPLSTSLYGSQFPKTPDQHCRVTGYYDANRRTVMLQLMGPLDASILRDWLEKKNSTKLKNNDKQGDKEQERNEEGRARKESTTALHDVEQQNSMDFLTAHAELKVEFARALLFMFQVCHVLVVHLPGGCFDLSYVGLFTAIDNARQRFLGVTSASLGEIGVSSRWYQTGRLCSPRVLFLFDKSPRGRQKQNISQVKKLEHALEDQIYRVLRKVRVVTNRSADSLFSIPKNDEFVYVQTGEDGNGEDRLGRAVQDLINSCQKFNGATNSQKDENPFGTFGINPYVNGGEPESKQSPFGAMGSTTNHSFTEFLQQHIDIALGPGFEDNVGKYAASIPTHFEVPKLKTWCNAVRRLYTLYYGDDIPKSTLDESEMETERTEYDTTCADDVIDAFREALNVDVKFSEARCAKVWPVAKALYLESLPQHYGTAEHRARLAGAMASLRSHGRGPRLAHYTARLIRFATTHWTSGRELCEVPSLTGRLCQRPKQYGEGATQTSCAHSSGVTTNGACDCGRTVGRREDPYDARGANHDHYVTLGRDCACGTVLQRVEFPVFRPSTDDFRAAQLFTKPPSSTTATTATATRHHRHQGHHQPSTTATTGTTTGTTAATTAILMTSQSPDPPSGSSMADNSQANDDDDDDNDDVVDDDDDDGGDDGGKSLTGEEDVNEIVIQVAENDAEQGKDKGLVRQPSTTEYLPGMLHSQSPPGLLPQFPSWSLVCLGPSSLYSHNLGLSDTQHPGFISGANFLLPWDVTVRLEHTQPWPSMIERNRSRKSHRNYGHSGREPTTSATNKANEFVVKIFVGMEYECPRGHRFMMSSPDKILRAATGLVKDSGNRVASSDMPLFFECPCRTSKPQLAQLMRIHVVSPKAPVNVTLDPKVQPGGTNSPVFITGFSAPIKLTQSSYWVLRLPYVYVGDRTVFANPGESINVRNPGSSLQYGRLLQGMYGISEMERE